MENIELIKGLVAKVVRRTNTEVELDTGANTNYIVCSNGMIISTNYGQKGLRCSMIGSIDRRGYNAVLISNGHNSRFINTHRLIAKCFIPNPNSLAQVNHKNEIKTDNRVENLEWCTNKYNANYGSRNKKISIANINGKCSKRIYQLDLNYNIIKEWPSISEAARYGFSIQHISSCCLGKRKTHKGYRWQFITD